MRKVELLPTRDCEAGYGPDYRTNTRLVCTHLREELHTLNQIKFVHYLKIINTLENILCKYPETKLCEKLKNDIENGSKPSSA